jgi:hypothetical protein
MGKSSSMLYNVSSFGALAVFLYGWIFGNFTIGFSHGGVCLTLGIVTSIIIWTTEGHTYPGISYIRFPFVAYFLLIIIFNVVDMWQQVGGAIELHNLHEQSIQEAEKEAARPEAIAAQKEEVKKQIAEQELHTQQRVIDIANEEVQEAKKMQAEIESARKNAQEEQKLQAEIDERSKEELKFRRDAKDFAKNHPSLYTGD